MSSSRGNLRLVMLLLVVVLIGAVAWLVLGDGDDSSNETVSAEIASVDTIRDQAADQGLPIYWAGPQDGAALELSIPEDGRTYIRYLTDGAQAGDPRPDFLTVGTYAFGDAVAALEQLSNQAGGVQRTAPGGGVVYFNRNQPGSVYLAYPGVDVQIEIFDPDPDRAKNLALSGQIVPVN